MNRIATPRALELAPGPAGRRAFRAGDPASADGEAAVNRVDPAPPTRRPDAVERWLRGAVLARLGRIRRGRLVLREGDREHEFGEPAERAASAATVTVLDPAFFAAVALGGSVGAGESYMAGEWVADDPAEVVRVLVRNRDVLDDLERGLARLAGPLRAIWHRRRRNSRDGSRRNIRDHYDLSNDLFARFLDETMTYSSAYFARPGMSLHEAQVEKLDRLCRKLSLRPEHDVLEIGTGWGSFAIHAASRYGCRVTTTTISDAQYELARSRVAAAGLADRVEVLKRDYRDLEGEYDRVVSIEMIEAVGHAFLPEYLRVCAARLRPDGMLGLQAITIADALYARALREVDFIKRHVFPGSFIPSVTAIADASTNATDLTLRHLEDFGPHYARTLRLWRQRFLARWGEIAGLGFDDRFRRRWEFYLAYCEGGFEERAIGVAQLVFARPDARDVVEAPPHASVPAPDDSSTHAPPAARVP